MRLTAIVGLLILACGCAQQPSVPIAPQPVESSFESTPGPTLMARVEGGYELKNHKFRVVISDQTGDVIFWGYVNPKQNILSPRGISASLPALPGGFPYLMVQARDEQTWECYGEDDNHIIWRKVYCLEKDALLVSVLILNNREIPLVTPIQITGDFPSMNIIQHDPEQFSGVSSFGTVSLHGYNEFHAPTTQPAATTLIQSDIFHLKPKERQGYTSVWMLSQ